jgi:uncharacterized protein YjiK
VKKIRIVLAAIALIALSLFVASFWLAVGPEKTVDSVIPVSIADYNLGKQARQQWSLPGELYEVSGLAVVDDDRILVHDDESAIVFEYRISTGQVVPVLQLDQPPLKIDLEGIAILDDDVYLVESTGQIYRIAEGMYRTGVIEDYEVFDPGLEDICEIEGLEKDLTETALVMVCKRMFEKRAKFISLYRVEPGTWRAEKLFDLGFKELESFSSKGIHPSGISIQFGSYIILSGRERLILQVSAAGEVITGQKLKKKYHRQAEGLGFLPDNRLVIADEGKSGRGRITIYKP